MYYISNTAVHHDGEHTMNLLDHVRYARGWVRCHVSYINTYIAARSDTHAQHTSDMTSVHRREGSVIEGEGL